MLSTKVIEDFREQTEEHFHPVDGMNAGKIEEIVIIYNTRNTPYYLDEDFSSSHDIKKKLFAGSIYTRRI